MHAFPLLLVALLIIGCAARTASEPSTMTASSPVLMPWLTQTPARGVILGLHSFGDHSAAFALMGPCLAKTGYALYSYDQAGFGQRQQQGHWPGETALVDEASQLARQLSEKHNMPVYLLGESLGGAVAMLASREEPESIAGLILAAPAVREGIRLRYGWNALIASGAALWPGYRFTVARDPENPQLAASAARRLAEDPQVMRRVRMDSYWGLIRIADSASNMASQITHPTLLLYGGQDQAVPQIGIERLHQHLQQAENHQYQYYPEGPHFLLQGHNWQQVCGDITAWLEQQRG